MYNLNPVLICSQKMNTYFLVTFEEIVLFSKFTTCRLIQSEFCSASEKKTTIILCLLSVRLILRHECITLKKKKISLMLVYYLVSNYHKQIFLRVKWCENLQSIWIIVYLIEQESKTSTRMTKLTAWFGTQHWQKFCNINDTFLWVLGILVNWHISTGILTKIARATRVNILVDICQFTRIRVTHLNVSLML